MKLNKKLLQKVCREKPHLARFLNISGLELVTLERVNECGALHWLIASDNKLQSDDGLESLKHLWHLDLSNNHMAMLGALSRYLALGTLILSNNNLKWIDLEKIRHAHILSISLHGNPSLDTDRYYRIHVIDCLPLIWELDGRLVTVTERLHVKQFFIDSELSQHPVRHKMGKTFRTSAIKNIGTEGIVSRQCKYIYSKFPMSETHTKHTDERRLAYLTHMVQEDILQWSVQLERGDPKRPIVSENFLDNLLEQRCKDPERCNMVMLLLVISLEFQLPTALIRSVLNSSDLDRIGTVSIMPFFLLPAKYRTRVICMLLNAAKVQRDNNKNQTGGLYPQLFMCLYYTVAQLTRISQTSESNMHKIKTIPLHSDYKALMACEVVSLMLNVPRFFIYLPADSGAISLTTCATGSPEIVRRAQEILYEAEDIFSVMPVRTAHKMVKGLIFNTIQERLNKVNIRLSDIPIGDRYLSLSDSLPIKPLHSVIWATEFLTSGQCVPRLDPPVLYPAREAAKPKRQQPKIGDKVLLGPQAIGEFAMILEGDIAMTKVDAVPLSNGAVESRLRENDAHYTYVDLKALCFAKDISMWRPVRAKGDKHTVHSIESSDIVSVTQKEALQGVEQASEVVKNSPLTKTPIVHAPKAVKKNVRPLSSKVDEKVVYQTSSRKIYSAGSLDANTNFALGFHEQVDGVHHNNDSNQNKPCSVTKSDISLTKSDTNFQLGNLFNSAGLNTNDDCPEQANEASVQQMFEEIQLTDQDIPTETTSLSPPEEDLDHFNPQTVDLQKVVKELC